MVEAFAGLVATLVVLKALFVAVVAASAAVWALGKLRSRPAAGGGGLPAVPAADARLGAA